MTDLYEILRTRIAHEVRSEPAFQRRTRPAWRDLPQAFLDARAAFATTWHAMIAEGESKGYLEWTNDYPGSELVITDHVQERVEDEFDETEEEHNARCVKEIKKRLEYEWDAMLKQAKKGDKR